MTSFLDFAEAQARANTVLKTAEAHNSLVSANSSGSDSIQVALRLLLVNIGDYTDKSTTERSRSQLGSFGLNLRLERAK